MDSPRDSDNDYFAGRRPSTRPQAQPESEYYTDAVYVGNLVEPTTEGDLREAFIRYGPIRDVKCFFDKQ